MTSTSVGLWKRSFVWCSVDRVLCGGAWTGEGQGRAQFWSAEQPDCYFRPVSQKRLVIRMSRDESLRTDTSRSGAAWLWRTQEYYSGGGFNKFG